MVATNGEANKALVRRLFEEVIDGGNSDLAEQLLRPDYIQHNPSAGQGIEGFKAYFADLERTKSRLHAVSTLAILHLMAEGDRVWIHTETCLEGIVRLRFEAMDLFRVEDGKLAEHWDVIQGRGILSAMVLVAAG